MNEDRYYDTNFVPFNGIKYCPYCGKPLEHFTEVDGYDLIEYDNCNCEDAQKEHNIILTIEKLRQEILSLQMQLPKDKYGIITNFEKLY